MEKYSLVKDGLGIRMGEYVENWKKLTTELEKGGYTRKGIRGTFSDGISRSIRFF